MKKDWIYLLIIAGLILFVVLYWNKTVAVNMSLRDIVATPGGWQTLLGRLKAEGKIGSWTFGFGS